MGHEIVNTAVVMIVLTLVGLSTGFLLIRLQG
uniref:Cytochrome b6-f complex subunit 7 n=1 Tax=Bulboplastis apyrenoidosa TaxID=1070855 RepID=A0A1Y9TM80_9RHOD|nr:cytochrome b6f complex subunit 7 [Bulboplastis apyrenoidosa]ARO90785.1 cytochrome b6f complex subunit 7 [Bulboplastis apyrenoidosa]